MRIIVTVEPIPAPRPPMPRYELDYTTRARTTGHLIRVRSVTDGSPKPYWTTCTEHGITAKWAASKDAATARSHPEVWCLACRRANPAPGPFVTFLPVGSWSAKVQCSVCGATGWGGQFHPWQETHMRGHKPCDYCGRMLVVKLDGMTRVHTRCPQ